MHVHTHIHTYIYTRQVPELSARHLCAWVPNGEIYFRNMCLCRLTDETPSVKQLRPDATTDRNWTNKVKIFKAKSCDLKMHFKGYNLTGCKIPKQSHTLQDTIFPKIIKQGFSLPPIRSSFLPALPPDYFSLANLIYPDPSLKCVCRKERRLINTSKKLLK